MKTNEHLRWNDTNYTAVINTARLPCKTFRISLHLLHPPSLLLLIIWFWYRITFCMNLFNMCAARKRDGRKFVYFSSLWVSLVTVLGRWHTISPESLIGLPAARKVLSRTKFGTCASFVYFIPRSTAFFLEIPTSVRDLKNACRISSSPEQNRFTWYISYTSPEEGKWF
jgi:hypothetical protein